MEVLDSSIQELYQKEPFWNICNPCQCKGHCCIGADIQIHKNEWTEIERYIRELSYEDKTALCRNIQRSSKCVFRTNDKCLIHAVRPANCRYTPYQYVVTADNHLRYTQVKHSKITGTCIYCTVDAPIDAATANELRQCKFAPLDNFGMSTLYLSLNWQVAHSEALGTSCPASELVRSIAL